jgi:hypothetical protein
MDEGTGAGAWDRKVAVLFEPSRKPNAQRAVG